MTGFLVGFPGIAKTGKYRDRHFQRTDEILYGDVNENLIIDIVDLILMINIILGQNTSDIYSFEAADVNQDGVIDIIDVISVVNMILDN